MSGREIRRAWYSNVFFLCTSLAVAGFVLPFIGRPVAAQEKKDTNKPQSSPAAVALYADAANAQNAGAFDVAVDQWDEFLKKYPQDPLAAKAQHYLGVCQMQLKKLADAAKSFDVVVKKYPDLELLEDAYLNLAWCQFSLAAPEKPELYAPALASFQALLKKYPKGKYVDQGNFFQGECFYHQGKKKEAEAFYDAVVKNHAGSPLRADAAYALGVTREELSDRDGAAQAYDLFLKDFPQHKLVAEVRLRKAEQVLAAGKLAEAEQQFAQLAKLDGFTQVDHALMRQAFCLVKQDKFADAATIYARVATDFAKSDSAKEALLSAGRWYYRAERMDEAATWLQKALDASGPDAVEAAHWLTRVQLRNKNFEQALAIVDKQLATAGSSPFVPNLLMDRADALYDLPNRKADAVAVYLRIASEHAKHELARQALYNAALGSLELEKFADGLKFSTQFLDQHGKDPLAPSARFVRAECRMLSGQVAEAEKDYAELLQQSANNPEAGGWQLRRGLALSLQKKYDDVVKLLSPLVTQFKLPDQVAEAQFLIGAAQFQLDQFAEAEKSLNASLAANAKWRRADETMLFVARTQQRLNRTAEAKATVQKLLAEFPRSKLLDQAHYRLGEFAYGENDLKLASSEYGVVIDKFADSTFVPYARYGRGWCQLKSKDFPGAVTSFGELLLKSPEHPLAADARFARGMARRQSGDVKGAVEDLTAYLKTNPPLEQKSHALYERGLAEVAAQDFGAAVTTLTALLKENEKYADADKVRYELAWAFKSQNKDVEALAQFRELADKYPDSPLAAEGRYHVAEQLYDQKQYEPAIKEYQLARQKAQGGDLPEKILYKLAWAYFQLKQYDPALETFAAQLTAHPQGMLAADGQFMKAECLYQLKKYEEALPALVAASQRPGLSTAIQSLVLLHAGQAAGQLKQWNETIKQLEQLTMRFPESPYLAEAWYELGWARQNLGKGDEALKNYEEAATRARDQVGARARFMMGEIYFERKQYDDAVKQFQRVMFGFGADNATADVKKWQAKSGYESARCHEVRIQGAKDESEKTQALAQTKKFYTYVIEKHPQDELAAEARKRLEALGKL